MNQKLKAKIYEAFSSVLPISLTVLVLSTLLVPMSIGTIVMFVCGTCLLVVGMGFFSLGADMAMMPIGEGVGAEITKSKKLWIPIALCFTLGFLITISEPDLSVLAQQVPSIPNMTLILTVAVGVGVFLVVSLLRIVFKTPLNVLLLILYAIVFTVSIFTPNSFIAVAFDSGGVTTGPMTVPFILALGAGLASVRGDKSAQDDSFGFVALCSVGPILAVMILGILFNPQDASYGHVIIPDVETMRDVLHQFMVELPKYASEVGFALVPIILFFIAFQFVTKRFPRRQMHKMIVGLIYTLIGLVLFLTGVNVGFIPVGSLLGQELATSQFKWLLVPIGMLIGYFIVAAEPAVHVLNHQVEQISGGQITQRAMNLSLSIGVAVSVGLSMVRVLSGISIYWLLIPGYAVALILTLKVPRIFTGIAFDSGGVASGPMTSTFLLPFVIGACEASGGNVLTDAFGVVAMVAMTPLIAIQIMGLLYQRKLDKMDKSQELSENNQDEPDMEAIADLFIEEADVDEHTY